MSHFKAKMRQIRFPLGIFAIDPDEGAYIAPQTP